ncbi:hypothetical protein F5Y16DRAFT_131950 [Xylariaceae sp. FL0255]|nr:hypothetical protein F5Y16DRAFT_131950 [Xylariaceae sp. FL0255]
MTSSTRKVKVTKDGMEFELPSTDKCWHFYIMYKCGCPVKEGPFRRDKVVKIKKDGHSGPCEIRGCNVGKICHVPKQEKCSPECRWLGPAVNYYPQSDIAIRWAKSG